jgi:hypothetical protein
VLDHYEDNLVVVENYFLEILDLQVDTVIEDLQD